LENRKGKGTKEKRSDNLFNDFYFYLVMIKRDNRIPDGEHIIVREDKMITRKKGAEATFPLLMFLTEEARGSL